jgi:hypothetical protein
VIKVRSAVLSAGAQRIQGNAAWLRDQGIPDSELLELLRRCPLLLNCSIAGPEWAAKLAVLQQAGVGRQAALQYYASYLHHSLPALATGLAFWRQQGSPQPLRLNLLVPGNSQERLKGLHAYLGSTPQQWAAFQGEYRASPDWRQLCEEFGLDPASGRALSMTALRRAARQQAAGPGSRSSATVD